jgi:hypothetical protein
MTAGTEVAGVGPEVDMDRDSSEYSSSKAPETREQAEQQDDAVDSRLLPGGAEPRTPSQQGMAGLDHDAIAGGSADRGQPREGDTGTDDTTQDE